MDSLERKFFYDPNLLVKSYVTTRARVRRPINEKNRENSSAYK